MVKILVLLNLLLLINLFPQTDFLISGELRQWHGIQITFNGPYTSEDSSDNPFTNYRLNVTFTHADTTYLVPGFYAADGNASETGAASGNKWRVIFTPDRTGEWSFSASFRKGNFIAVDTALLAGKEVSFDGLTGSFFVSGSNKSLPDFRSQGMLLYNGTRYLQFTGTKKYFIKGGSNSPENFLAYNEFDQTPKKHKFQAHAKDWKTGDPLWQSTKGTAIIGAINYLSSKGMNSLYMLTFNVNGDGRDVWPYISKDDRLRFDCSKLDQWNIVFSHMQSKGILCHFVTQETENDHELDNGDLGNQRKLYYRELIARFGYHPAVIWNLGEEITNTTSQIKDFAEYIRYTDPYDHIITMHNIRFSNFIPLMGSSYIDGPSMYIYDIEDVNKNTKKYINESANSGRPWVCFLDEIGPFDKATPPDNIDFWHDDLRKNVLWGHLMAGGAGLEWYMGYEYPHNDLTLENFRSRDHLWNLTSNALNFFNNYLPFIEMSANDHLVTPGNYCFAKINQIYAVYLPKGGSAYLDLPDTGYYQVKWYNPRTGDLQEGTKAVISGGGNQFIGLPPTEITKDWIAVIKKDMPGERLSFITPYSVILNDTSQKISIKLKILDENGNLSTSAEPVTFLVNGPGSIYEGNSVIPVNGYASVTFIASSDTGTTYISAAHQEIISDNLRIRTVTQLSFDTFEEYKSSTDLSYEWKSIDGRRSSVELDSLNPLSGKNSLKIKFKPEADNILRLQKDFNRSFEGAKYISFRLRTDITDMQMTIYLKNDSHQWLYNLPGLAPGEHFYIIPLDSFTGVNDTIGTRISDLKSLQLQLSGTTAQEPGEVVFDSFIFSTTDNVYTGVEVETPDYYILQNYPNPFNKTTKIRYNLFLQTEIRVAVYDILGNQVDILFDGTQSSGEHFLLWNADNLASGIYLIRIESKDFAKSIKSILLK